MLENLPCAVHQSPFHRILQYLICAQSSGFLVDAAQADLRIHLFSARLHKSRNACVAVFKDS